MEIILKIHAPELTNALMVLAEALDRRSNGIANATAILEKKKHGTNTPNTNIPMQGPDLLQASVQQVVPIQQAPPAVDVVPVQSQVQQPIMAQAEPIQQPTQAPTAVPIQAQTYTMEQLAVAATQLVDAGT